VTISMDLPPFMEARESAPAQAGATRRLVWPLGRNYGARWAPLRHDGGSSFDQLAGAGPVAGFRAARRGFHESDAPGSAPGAPLSSEDGRRTGRPGAATLPFVNNRPTPADRSTGPS
jgi:hypothetical protein